MAVYERAAAGQPLAIGTAKVVPGSMRALAASYYQSPDYVKMSSKAVRRNIIEKFLRETDANGQPNADKHAATLEKEHVIAIMAARADKPESANGLRKALRALMQHAITIRLRSEDPTLGVKSIPSKSRSGFHTWTEEEIAQFEAFHPIDGRPRLAMALGLFTGQARQDAVAMGPHHIRDGILHWLRKKTARSTAIRLYITEFEKPFTAAGFGGWFRDQCDKAGLPHCTFHGLRKGASRRLAEYGCTPHEIASIKGHATLKEIERYTKDAERRLLAKSAMEKFKRGTSSG